MKTVSVLMLEVWPLDLSVTMEEAWPQCLSTPLKIRGLSVSHNGGVASGAVTPEKEAWPLCLSILGK